MGKRTPLYDQHVAASAKIVDFSGWDMPLHYGSQVEEHHIVRRDAGMFDVSHMTVVDLNGARVAEFLRHLLANDVNRLQKHGKALYTCMLNANGGVIDDLIVYLMKDQFYRIVFNAGTREKALAWVRDKIGSYDLSLTERDDLAMIAVQGPNARNKVHQVVATETRHAAAKLTPFTSADCDELFIARTGYTGEDGYELMILADKAATYWRALREAGVAPIGLGARDTLRLEAGMNLYGTDMGETTTPLESGLGWTVAWEPETRDFIGRAALEKQRDAQDRMRFVGLVLEGKGVIRNHAKVSVDGRVVGEVTSGSFSPTLGRSIAFARIPRGDAGSCHVDIRGNMVPALIVKPPFVRNGKACIDLPE